MSQNQIIDLRGCKLNIWRAGKGEPLLFLHGTQGIADGDAALAALAEHFDVIAPDHPGFGRSGMSENVDDTKDLALFYLDLLDHLKLERAHVAGECIGGWTALEMAIHASNRLKSLSLVNSAGLRLKGVPRGDMFVCSEADMLKMLFHGDGAEAWTKATRGTSELEDIYERNRAAAAKFSWSPRLCNPKLDRWLHRVGAPTHIVWGERNQVLPKAYGEGLKSLIPGASLKIISDCAHFLRAEQPRVFAQEITQFIARARS